jgi:isoamylase
MFQFVASLIRFRKRRPILRKKSFLKDEDIAWHGHIPNHPDWKIHSRFIAFTLKDEHTLYVAFNADFHPAQISLPPLPENQHWKQLVNTADSWDRYNLEKPEKGQNIGPSIKMAPYSALVAEAH